MSSSSSLLSSSPLGPNGGVHDGVDQAFRNTALLLGWPTAAAEPPRASGEPRTRPARPVPGRGAGPAGADREAAGAGEPPVEAPRATRVLLVEDDSGLRELMRFMLADRGLEVTAFATAEEAWEAYRRERFPLIVLDWLLPGMDGLELCRRIRELPDGDASVVMVITARDRPQDLQAILGAGANDYLPKPFDVAAFQVRLTIAEQQARVVQERRRNDLLERDRNRVLELIAANEPVGEVLAQLALLVERQVTDARCAVLLAREGALFHEAAPSLPEELVRALDGQPIGEASWACELSAYRAEPVLLTELGSAPAWQRHADLARAHGLGGCWSLPICSGAGRVLGLLVVYTPGPRKPSRADVELLQAASRLASLAIDHARLFDEAAMVEALQALTRLKAEFLSTASHELRTPLSLIYGYAELLKERAPRLSPEQVVEMAGEIHAGSTTMIRLVDDLLDFSRIEQGRLQLERRRVDVSDLLNRLVETFRLQPGGEWISAELPDGLEATLDPDRFTQIVGNLLSNALRYAPDAPIRVRATLRRNWLRVEVADQGPGIPFEEQPRVWERFFRGSRFANSVKRGSGLGLAVVKHLVELQGGRVGLRSIPGQGAIFWFTIPAEAGG